MSDIFNKIEEAERVIAELKARNGYDEVKAQRATVPGLGGHSNRMHEMNDADKRFLDYVRTGEKKSLVLDATGQYLVSPAVEVEIGRRLAEEVTIRKLASKRHLIKTGSRPEISAKLKWPRADWKPAP